MIPLAFACAALVVAACLHVAHRRRSLAERLVDALYRAAAIVYAITQAADSALCRYRAARQEIRRQHVPMYAEVRRWRAVSRFAPGAAARWRGKRESS